MPNHDIHVFIDQIFVGKSYRRLHQAIDCAVRFYGKGHRRFFHTESDVVWIASFLFPGDPKAVVAGKLHLLIDDLCTNDPCFEKFLENMIKQAQERKRDNERRNKWVQTIFEQMNQNNKFLMKMMEENFKLALGPNKNAKKRNKDREKERKKGQQQLVMMKRILEKGWHGVN